MHNKTDETSLPCITALSVTAAFHKALITKYGYLFSEAELLLIKHFVDTGIEANPSSFNETLIRAVSALPYSWQQGFFNKPVIPANDEIIMLGKFMIRHKLEEAIANGAKQVVIIGEGYDTLSLIFAAKYPGVKFYEVGMGRTLQYKLDAIKTMPDKYPGKSRINKNLFLIEGDLCEKPLAEILNSTCFQSTKQTFFLAENLTCYLNEESNRRLLFSINYLCKHDDSELFISYITKMGYYSGSVETAQFSLAGNMVLSFAADGMFDVVAKKSAIDMLEDIGHKNGVQFYRNQDIKEYYYVLKNQTGILESKKGVIDVPDLEIKLPANPLEKQSTCVLM